MDKELLFSQKLEELQRAARENNKKISETRVQEIFEELELPGAQMDMVYDYIKKKGITLISKESGSIGMDIPILTGSVSDLDKYIKKFLTNIKDIARLYEGQGVLFEDLIGEGNLAVYEACAGLSSPRGADEKKAFEAYLAARVMEAMELSVNETLNQKDIEASILSRVEKVGNSATELSDLLRRKITVDELLKENPELSEEEIRTAIKLSGNSLDVEG